MGDFKDTNLARMEKVNVLWSMISSWGKNGPLRKKISEKGGGEEKKVDQRKGRATPGGSTGHQGNFLEKA